MTQTCFISVHFLLKHIKSIHHICYMKYDINCTQGVHFMKKNINNIHWVRFMNKSVK